MADPNITTLYNWLISDEVGMDVKDADSAKEQWEKGDSSLDAEFRVTATGSTPSAPSDVDTGTKLLAQDWAWYEASQ